ncbi:MAG TPA: acido-empty-quinoprotein group A [Vicinamibacterales bacterium]|nr:acido-empty-quinoprotein group A [Vicinamibacterales bacterium]
MRTRSFVSVSGISLAVLLSACAAALRTPPPTGPSPYSQKDATAGEPLFAANCAFCHGRDAMGGQTGPDLTRSELVADDVRGDKIAVVVRSGRPDKGMPPLSVSDSDLTKIVAFIHNRRVEAGSLLGARRRVDESDLATGDPHAGEQYFNGAGGCAGCHSPGGDLAGVADRVKGLELLQRMLYPSHRSGQPQPAKATVTLPSGETIAGRLAGRDEFTIALRDASGRYRSWRTADVKYVVDNPLDAHVALLRKYTDADMHNVLAYLQTLHGATPASRASGAAPPGAVPAATEPKDDSGGFDPAALLNPPADSWPTYHGDYTGQRHSRLSQITPDNVRQLGLAWSFQTGQSDHIKATPILVDGVLYVTTPDNMWAVDARNGREIWHYSYPKNSGFHIGHRGAAVYRNTVYLTTPDAHLVAVDARTGKVRWNVELADAKKGYWSTNAPLVVRDHLIVGVSGDFDNLPGLLQSFDPRTGALQWKFYSTPPAGATDPPSGGATGGQMWMTGTYDPALNLVFVGTGNPTPVLNGPARAGDNPWTCSILAIDPDTGKLAWGFQASPHDTHDWDAAEVPVLVDATFKGAPRKLLLQASRNGYFFVLDRTTGKSLLTTPFADVNWASGIDAQGRPVPDPAKEPSRDGRLVAPNEGGGTNYRSPSFDPATGTLVVSAVDAYGIYFFKEEHGNYGWAGADYGVHGKGAIRAIDYKTGQIRWSHEIGGGSPAGVLTTDSGLTFTGDGTGNVIALRTSDGSTLWHSAIGSVGNSPITFELDGRQHIVFAGGSALYAWTLPR